MQYCLQKKAKFLKAKWVFKIGQIIEYFTQFFEVAFWLSKNFLTFLRAYFNMTYWEQRMFTFP